MDDWVGEWRRIEMKKSTSQTFPSFSGMWMKGIYSVSQKNKKKYISKNFYMSALNQRQAGDISEIKVSTKKREQVGEVLTGGNSVGS